VASRKLYAVETRRRGLQWHAVAFHSALSKALHEARLHRTCGVQVRIHRYVREECVYSSEEKRR